MEEAEEICENFPASYEIKIQPNEAVELNFKNTIPMQETSLDAIDWRLLDALQQDVNRSNQDLADALGISPPTCLRRVRRLREAGLIEREVAILAPERIAALQGHGLTAIVEVALDRQDAARLEDFEGRAVDEPAVQQCYRVSPGPDFVLVVQVRDMPDYLALAQRLFTADANVRNVRAFFSQRRACFRPRLPLAGAG